MLIDAHCHLDFADFDADREAVFERAHAAGVEHFIVPGTIRSGWPGVLALGQRTDVSACLGLHPYFMDTHRLEDAADVEALDAALEESPGVVAVGECGIDARFGDTLAAQWALFDAQLRLAKRHNLPMVIHCVHANDKVAKRLRQLALPAGGLIHAFSGSPEQARTFLNLGFTLGLGGALTYPRAQRLHRMVKALPADGFVLETDSPDMSLFRQQYFHQQLRQQYFHQQQRGSQSQRNEPANVARVCEHVAALRGEDATTIATQSTANARTLFALPL